MRTGATEMSDRKISETGVYQSSKYVRKSAIILIIFGIAVAFTSYLILTNMDNNSNAHILIIIEVVMLSLLPIVLGFSNLIILKRAKNFDDSNNSERTVIVNSSSMDPSIKYISFIEYEHACPSCGTQLDDDAIFCTKCGTKQN